MTGSIQEKSGKLYVVLSYRDEEGKLKHKWVATELSVRGNKKKAEMMIPDVIETYREIEGSNRNTVMFVDYIRDWLIRKKTKVQQSTWEGYEIYINRHIIPYFEPLGLTINQVTPKHIQDYYESRLTCQVTNHKALGLKPASIKKHAPVLNQVFEDAVIAELVVRNPVPLVPLPKNEKHEPVGKFMTVEEANAMLEAFHDHELQPLIFVTLFYGLRRSEVLGLKWDAVDFEANTIKIQHTIVKQKTIIAKDTTKSATSRHTYPLLPEIRELLLTLREKQQHDRIDFGTTYTESGYVFVWSDGKPFRPDYITRTFKKVLDKHGLPPMRFHDIRHSTASILYDKGWNMKDIQEWLRHADISTTGNIYTHISKLRKESIGNALENTFKL